MKKLKVIYLAHFRNPDSDDTEGHIKYALEQLGHEVVPIDESTFVDKDITSIKDADLLLFHKAGLGRNLEGKNIETMVRLLNNVVCKKVFWYFDRIIYCGLPFKEDRQVLIDTFSKYCDYGFLTDDTFIRRNRYKNLYKLMQGIGNEDTSLGKYRKEYDFDVVFTGSPYTEQRQDFVRLLSVKYGKRFAVFNNVFNRDLYDMCASAKIFVAPLFPSDDFHWSSRIYMTIGSGGFMVHPDLEGLKEEFTEGKHFAGYKNEKGMIETIDYFLEHEDMRKAIQMEGYKHCLANHTYLDRVKKMLDRIYT